MRIHHNFGLPGFRRRAHAVRADRPRPGALVLPVGLMVIMLQGLTAAGGTTFLSGVPATSRRDARSGARETPSANRDEPGDPEEIERRRSRFDAEISRLSTELDRLAASEHGLLGELKRLGALARLRSAELGRLHEDVAEIERRLEASEVALLGLEARATKATEALRARLRSLYRQGRLRHYRILLARDSPGDLLGAARAVSALAASDAERIAQAREARIEAAIARRDLAARRARLVETRSDALKARGEVDRARSAKSRLLKKVRWDQRVRSAAIEELRSARESLGSIAEDLGAEGERSQTEIWPSLDISRFRGLLKWPCEGEVISGFGRQLHPRFGTMVPHDGLDISAPLGEDIRAVFDGTVGYVGWLSGYGLTVLIDHGRGYVSVYAHASALLVEKGERISAGQLIGKVGDTGSLGGPGLYFEVRRNGKALDPALWLEQR